MHLEQVQYNFLDLCDLQILHTVVYTYMTLLAKASLVYISKNAILKYLITENRPHPASLLCLVSRAILTYE